MRDVLVFVISNYSLSFLVLGLVVGVLVGLRRAGTMVEALLSYYLLFALGFGFLTNFVMHVFFQQTVSRFIGWAPSPFETEVGLPALASHWWCPPRLQGQPRPAPCRGDPAGNVPMGRRRRPRLPWSPRIISRPAMPARCSTPTSSCH